MKNNKVKIVEYIKRTFYSYIVIFSRTTIYKSSLVMFVGHICAYLYNFFISLLHAEEDMCGKRKEMFPKKKKKKSEHLEILYKEGLIDIYNIACYVKSQFGKDTQMLVLRNNKHSKYHVDYLFDLLKKTYYSRNTPSPIIIKGSSCSFKLVVNCFYRSSTKYLQISNIVKKNITYDESIRVEKKDDHLNPKIREQFFFSKNMNVIDKITIHNKKDVKSSLESLNTFFRHYGDHIYSKNVSWYTNTNSKEYKAMVLSDIVCSTENWCTSYEEMSMAITKHDYITLELIGKYKGTIGRNEGDSFFIFFDELDNAIKFASAFTKQIHQIKVLGQNMNIKVAVHAGMVKMSNGVNRDGYGQPIKEICELLAKSTVNKVNIKKEILESSTLSYQSSFCVH